jgi:hypothetical protein
MSAASSSLPTGLEHQFGPELEPPQRGDRAIVWRHGVALEVTVAAVREVSHSPLPQLLSGRTLVSFVLDGSLSTAPADRVTRLSRLQPRDL